ncbi:MAG TPA: aspartate dehydrogenase [Candidatus Hydrogenedentes bacterium]|nr:aspartate dehydrogenase [Candidatus Hydrogenedentota bacterium]HIJ73248.1 aspartate dehydrogenase [Candidatus Hydrogenedentota bacterium]
MPKMKVGLVGCGNIATDLCIAVKEGDIPAEIAAVTDIARGKAVVLLRTFDMDAAICSLDENAAAVDYLIECAAADAVKEVVEAAIKHGTDCLIVSVGGLVEDPELFVRAREADIALTIPSGAICGLDGIRAAQEAGLRSVTLTTRKPPKGLAGAPYLVEHSIDVDGLTEPRVVFEGTAAEAIKAFPKNVNVAATISLAGIGPDETRVQIIADPAATVNSHEIVVDGAFGRLRTVTENVPSPRNAKSSYLASLSACAELRDAATAFAARRTPGW